jgi:hypothetical protein
MKKPNALVQLLEDLSSEHIQSDVDVVKTSKAVIYPNDEAAVAEDGIELSASECSMIFANSNTVERMIDAIEIDDASIALYDVGLSSHVLELLERSFVAVDEG